MRKDVFLPFLFSAAALLACVPGCSTDEEPASLRRERGADAFDDPSGGYSTDRTTPEQAGLSYRGSPLCRREASSCNPDSTNNRIDDGPCASLVNEPLGCRVGSSGNEIKPLCLPTGSGVEGSACSTGEDCAAGFDCVAGPDGAMCRRYCCLGSCASHVSQNGSKTFCDIQKLAALPDVKVPVCMPIKACELMTPGECAAHETCSIVTESGETGCVTNGNARAGESCDEEQCSAGLVCIGQPGSRKCYQLCRMDQSSSCGQEQVCKTSVLFKDMSFGICKNP